jgi:hypothetical protein
MHVDVAGRDTNYTVGAVFVRVRNRSFKPFDIGLCSDYDKLIDAIVRTRVRPLLQEMQV